MSRVTAWYVSHGTGKSAEGPFATDLVRAMLRDGELNAMDLVFREGESEWRPASMYSELRNVSNSSVSSSQYSAEPNELPDTPQSVGRNYSTRSIEEADISWIVLRPHSSTYLQEGPFKTNYIREGLKKGTFQFGQYAWHIGMRQWMRIGDLREFDRRSSPRDSAPHVPPPLPDPISAVLLEDDGDFESEEFHVNLKPSKYDATPTDPMIFSGKVRESVAVGGAAAVNPEASGQDLARVPWEERISASALNEHSGVFTQAVELIDDESSFAGFSESEPERQPPASNEDDFYSQTAVSHISSSAEDFAPQPFVPPPVEVEIQDRWEKWGRYLAAVGMGAIAAVFSGHLLTHENTANADQVRRSAERTELDLAKSQLGEVRPVETPPILSVENSQESLPTSVSASSAASTGLDLEDPMAGPEGGLSAPVPAAATQAVPQMPLPTSVSPSSEAAIVGLKLNQPGAQILLQGAFPYGQPIQVTFKGRLGEVLSKLNVRKTVTVNKSGAEIPSIKIKDVGLPDGAYTVEVLAGAIQLKSDVFIGKRDAKFLDRLEAHLRENSFELQAQKKVLFYAAQELDSLARDLGLNYGQLRGKPDVWAKFYSKWKAKVAAVEKSVGEVSKKSIEEQAYPDETVRLSSLLGALKETSSLFEQGVGAQRDVASDSLTDLIAELARQREAIGSATSRASQSNGQNSGSSDGPATSKAL